MIERAETKLQPVRLKFLLGELLLGAWWPRLVVADPHCFGLSGWPDPPETLRLALPPEADGFLCRKVDAGRFLPGVGRYGEFLCYVQRRDVLHYVELSGDFEGYLKTFSPKSRQNLVRSVRRFLERAPGNGCEVLTAVGDMARFHAEALAISRETYQSRLLDAGLPEDAAFVRWMMALAERGEARGYLLRDGDRAIAFAWCRGRGERLIYDIIGYLPECASLSPGSVLLYLIIQDAFAAGRYGILDFGPGEAQYKSMFATHRQEFTDAYLFRPTLRHWLLAHMHFRLAGLAGAAGALLERWGLKKRVKGWLRAMR